jgi:2-phosphoglycerate kinase
MISAKTTWKVLLIGGSSGVGKSSIARQLGRRFGTPWMQVDDLRLALQRSRVILPEQQRSPLARDGACEVVTWTLAC